MIKQLYKTFCVMILLVICKGEPLTSNSSQKCFKTLFQFGASLFDTGNAVIAFPKQAFQPANPPYGCTFPGHPHNRFSDGKLIVDHLTDAFKVPPLNPFLGGLEQFVKKKAETVMGDYRNGVCFSVALATALSVQELLLNGVGSPNLTLNPLTSDVQFQSFQAVKQAANASATNQSLEIPELNAFESALYLPGEFGVNDYRTALYSGFSIEHVRSMVSSVVKKIVHLIQKLYGVGARDFLVIGVPPQGCTPFYLTMLNGSRDEFGCLAEVNGIHQLHESMLKMAIQNIRKKLPGSNLMFADYYGAFISVLKNPAHYGMEVTNVACCGGGGPYNYNPEAVCGTKASAMCSKPGNHVFWDDFHATDVFNHIITNKFLSGEFLDPPNIKLGCPS